MSCVECSKLALLLAAELGVLLRALKSLWAPDFSCLARSWARVSGFAPVVEAAPASASCCGSCGGFPATGCEPPHTAVRRSESFTSVFFNFEVDFCETYSLSVPKTSLEVKAVINVPLLQLLNSLNAH